MDARMFAMIELGHDDSQSDPCLLRRWELDDWSAADVAAIDALKVGESARFPDGVEVMRIDDTY